MKEKETATRQESGKRLCDGTAWMEGDAQRLSELKPDAWSLLPELCRGMGLWNFQIPLKL